VEIAASESAKAKEEVALAQAIQKLSSGRGDGGFQCAMREISQITYVEEGHRFSNFRGRLGRFMPSVAYI
jgi:hypothetical protein